MSDLQAAAERWVRHLHPEARLGDFQPMPGNAGLSFGFDALVDGSVVDRFVVRIAPPGVARRGNTDVLRQVPLLRALERSGVPVAPLLWASDDPSWFGSDAIVQRRLPARPLHMYDPQLSVRHAGDVGPYLRQAVEALARIHAVDWPTLLGEWEEPRTATGEVEHWRPLLAKAERDDWRRAGAELADHLVATAPPDPLIGLVHGDYQTNNILYGEDGSLVAVVDWEIATISVLGLDLGWLAMMTDGSFWHPDHRPRMLVRCDPAELQGWYESAGRTIDHLEWCQALAGYRFGVIAAFNHRLHRTGRRPDPFYEQLAPSVSYLFRRGLELLAS